jgi:hypothetical protein
MEHTLKPLEGNCALSSYVDICASLCMYTSVYTPTSVGGQGNPKPHFCGTIYPQGVACPTALEDSLPPGGRLSTKSVVFDRPTVSQDCVDLLALV